MLLRIRLVRKKKERRSEERAEQAPVYHMSLRIRLVLLIVVMVTLVAMALSALHLDTLINTLSDDAVDRSQRASQEVSSFLIDYLNQHAGPTINGPEGAKEEWYRLVSTEPDITSRLVKTMALSRALVEINVADQNSRILASSSERRVGTDLASLRDFAQWTKGSVRSRLVDLMTGDNYYQAVATLGFPDQPAPVLSVQVVTSSVLLLHEPVDQQVTRLALVSLGSLLAVLLFTILATNLALQPLKRIDQTVDRIVQGNFVESGDAGANRLRGAPKEFVVLESKLNLLGQQFLGARENATELRHDVDLLLQRMASQLDVASRLAAISRLTGGVAHEIKNPLNAIALRLDFLRAKLGADDELDKDIDVLAKEIARLDRVVKTFLDFSRPVEVHFEDIDLSELTREVAELMTPPARHAHVALEVNTPQGPVVLRGDADLLKQALLNLVNNAIEAMHDGGCLRLATGTENGFVNLEVADNGPGIPAAQRDRVFQLYFTTKSKGSGIGLALTYRAVQLHNGTIAFESEEGQGTTFRLQFPASIRHA
jgi:signal transduction histidine kinase